jgi:Fe-S-cluster containining protein
MADRRNPCFEHDCHICCVDTRMTLTESDVARLRAAGHQQFFFVNDDRDLQLVNVDGHCIFLVDGRCSVHCDRPQGCRTYPLILDLSVDRIVLDDVCPWSSEFSFSQEDEVRLRSSVIDEENERRLRASRTGSG